MTLATMKWHESVTIQHDKDDFRRAGLVHLAERHAAGKRVLDMRTLSGWLSVSLAERGMDIMGLDGYEEAVERTNKLAESKGMQNCTAYLWDLETVPEPVRERPFDTIVSYDIMNHVPDEEKTFADTAKMLKDGGRLILTVPAFPWLLGKRDQTLGHLRRYTKKSLTEKLKRQGFRVEKMRYYNFLAFPVYLFVEKLLNKQLSDKARYAKSYGGRLHKLLAWWYRNVETKLIFPFGLSLFVIAKKEIQQEKVQAAAYSGEIGSGG